MEPHSNHHRGQTAASIRSGSDTAKLRGEVPIPRHAKIEIPRSTRGPDCEGPDQVPNYTDSSAENEAEGNPITSLRSPALLLTISSCRNIWFPCFLFVFVFCGDNEMTALENSETWVEAFGVLLSFCCFYCQY